MTIMFCSFDAQPLILRLYGQGRTVLPHEAKWNELSAHFNPTPGQRQIVVLHIESVQTSCGFGVPRFEFQEERPALVDWCEKKGPEGMEEYRRDKNRLSIDGLPTRLMQT